MAVSRGGRLGRVLQSGGNNCNDGRAFPAGAGRAGRAGGCAPEFSNSFMAEVCFRGKAKSRPGAARLASGVLGEKASSGRLKEAGPIESLPPAVGGFLGDGKSSRPAVAVPRRGRA